MALLFMDSFDHYTTVDIIEKYTSASGTPTNTQISAGNGRHGSSAIWSEFTAANSTNPIVTKILSPTDATIIIGFALKPSAVNNLYPLFTVGDNASWHGGLYGASGNVLEYKRGADYTGTVLGTTSSLSLGVFTFVEILVTIHDTAGVVTVKFNGTTALSLTGQDTKDLSLAGWTRFGLHSMVGAGGTGSSNVYIDDLYVLDGSGSAPWNAFLGDVRVDSRNPTGSGATTGWTPSIGSNWQNVDDATPDDDTTYNIATSSGLTDTFVFQDAPVLGAVIYGVQHCINVKKSDAGASTIASVVRHSGTDNVGPNITPNTTYGYGLAINQTNPGTGVQWTESGFNAAEFGYKRTS